MEIITIVILAAIVSCSFAMVRRTVLAGGGVQSNVDRRESSTRCNLAFAIADIQVKILEQPDGNKCHELELERDLMALQYSDTLAKRC